MKNEIDKIINLIQTGNNIEAIRLAKSLFLKFPNNINAIKILAYSYIQIGNFEKVIKLLTEGYETQNKTKDYDYYNNIGYDYLQLDDYKESIKYLKNAIKFQPKSLQAYISLADVNQKLKDLDEVYRCK